MTECASTFLPFPHRRDLYRPIALLACAAALAALALALVPARASAVVKLGVGLQPRNQETVIDGSIYGNTSNTFFYNPDPATFADAAQGPVLHESNIYAIYWDPTYHYHDDWAEVIDEFLKNLGGLTKPDDVFAVDSQYTDTTNKPATERPTFRGAYTDTVPYPSSGNCSDPEPLKEDKVSKIKALACLTSEQVSAQLESYISAHKLPKGMGTVYYVLTPPGVTVCLGAGGPSGHCSDFKATEAEWTAHEFEHNTSYANSFCSYHAAINPGSPAQGSGETILYGVIPWVAGGKGDGQLAAADQTPAYFCQDGGFNPSSSPIEQHFASPFDEEPNQVTCPSEDGFCDRGLADIEINQLAVEEQNIITDPLLNGWQDSVGDESTDECRNFFAPIRGGTAGVISEETDAGNLTNQVYGSAHYYINDAFDMAADGLNFPGVPCLTGISEEAKFSAPSAVPTGTFTGFNGMESDITLDAGTKFTDGREERTYAKYTWSFRRQGSATPAAVVEGYAPGAPPCAESEWKSPCAASVYYAFPSPGSWEVSLTVEDVGGNLATQTQEIDVLETEAERVQREADERRSKEEETTHSTEEKAKQEEQQKKEQVAKEAGPKVTVALAAGQHLGRAESRGVLVAYETPEQVTGHFELLLSRSDAAALGIHAHAAEGAPGDVVVGYRVLNMSARRAGGARVYVRLSAEAVKGLKRHHVRSLVLGARLEASNLEPGTHPGSTLAAPLTLSESPSHKR